MIRNTKRDLTFTKKHFVLIVVAVITASAFTLHSFLQNMLWNYDSKVRTIDDIVNVFYSNDNIQIFLWSGNFGYYSLDNYCLNQMGDVIECDDNAFSRAKDNFAIIDIETFEEVFYGTFSTEFIAYQNDEAFFTSKYMDGAFYRGRGSLLIDESKCEYYPYSFPLTGYYRNCNTDEKEIVKRAFDEYKESLNRIGMNEAELHLLLDWFEKNMVNNQ